MHNDNYLVSSSHSSEVRDVGNGAHRESLMNQAIVYKHVGHTKDRNSKTLFIVEGILVNHYFMKTLFLMKLLIKNFTPNQTLH